MRFGIFLSPHHTVTVSPARQLHEDLELIEFLDWLGFDEAWFGEHHSGVEHERQQGLPASTRRGAARARVTHGAFRGAGPSTRPPGGAG